MSTRVNNFLCLTFALAIRRSASQVLTVTPPCIPDKAEVILRCQTDNFNNAILFFLGATNNGGCDGGACSSSGTAGYIPSQSGSLYTYMTITEYNDSRDGGVWTCNDGGVSSNGYSLQLGNCEVTTEVLSTEGPTSQMSTYLATERTTSGSNIFESSNTTIPEITGSIIPTSGISASTIYTGTTNFYFYTKSANFYSNTEITTSYVNTDISNLNANVKTTNFYASTKTTEVQAKPTIMESNSMSTYHSMFFTTTENYVSRSFNSDTSQIQTETFAMSEYHISLYNEMTSSSSFKTSISFLVNTLSDDIFHTLRTISDSLITSDYSLYSTAFPTIYSSVVVDTYIDSSITVLSFPSLANETSGSAFDIPKVSPVSRLLSKTETKQISETYTTNSSAVNTILNSKRSDNFLSGLSINNRSIQQIHTSIEFSWVSTTSVIYEISYATKMLDPSFTSYKNLSETNATLLNDNKSSQMPSMIDTGNNFLNTTHIFITSSLDDTSISFSDFMGGFQTFSQGFAASVLTSFDNVYQSTDHHLSLQTTEYLASKNTDFFLYLTSSFYESNTHDAATGIYSIEKLTSGTADMHNSVITSKMQEASEDDQLDFTTDFKSTYIEPSSESTHVFFSPKKSYDVPSTLQSTSLLLPLRTNRNDTRVVDSYMKTTDMLTFQPQSGIPTVDLPRYTNPSSFQISTVILDSKSTWLMTTSSYNNATMSSMIKTSFQQTIDDNGLTKIDNSIEDFMSKDQEITILSSSTSASSTITIKGGLSEKNKTIIFISTTSAVITFIVVMLLIIFAKVYLSKYNMKPRKEGDNISWSNKSRSSKTDLPDNLFTWKSIYPLLNTSSTSFKMHPYEHNWTDIA